MSGMTAQGFETLLAEHGAALWRLASGYTDDHSEREDLYQEIVLALWLAMPRFRGECSQRTFVFRVAHNRGLTHRRLRRRIGWEPLADEETLPAATTSPLARTVETHARRRLYDAIRGLPAGQRQVVMMTLEELSQREIAEVLGISEGNVAVRLHRAKKGLAALLGREEEP
jgi:RNA polymerase sigma-70 factor (ECF subfamily)